jgi:alkylhydroperoxidase family enzyme
VPRIPYLPDADCGPAELVEAIRARRGGRLIELDRMLLHAPAFARGWNALLRAVRTELELPPRLRELAICAVAVANSADYEFAQHAPEFLAAGGTEAQLAALRDIGAAALDDRHFDAAERALLRLTIEMTREVAVDEATFAAIRAALGSDQRTVELVGTIATYNMVSRFLVALGVAPE